MSVWEGGQKCCRARGRALLRRRNEASGNAPELLLLLTCPKPEQHNAIYASALLEDNFEDMNTV